MRHDSATGLDGRETTTSSCWWPTFASVDGAAESIRADLQAICATEVAPDGVVFDPRSIRLEAIRREDEYAGTRARLVATCGSIKMMLQVDLGVGDAAWPPPEPLCPRRNL